MAERRWTKTFGTLSMTAAVVMVAAAAAADPIYRSIDGTGNNSGGAAGSQLLRMTVPAAYPDGFSMPTGLPSAREVSNAVAAQSGSIPNPKGATDFLWQWGQFLDHDIDLTHTGTESVPIATTGDPLFPSPIPFSRSNYDPLTGADASNPRQQVNSITAFIDASNVYGSDAGTAASLRTFDGGKLKSLSTSDGDLLPLVSGSAVFTDGDMFLAGDVRANEQVALTSMHTLFMREHNRLAGEMAALNPKLPGETDAAFDERIYQTARKIVGAEMQAITYNEFLPLLLGDGALSDYAGHDPSANPGIANVFSTAAYRFGHSTLSSTLLRLDENGNEIADGNLALKDAFFSPAEIIDNGIEPILRGLVSQIAQDVDPYVIDDVRNFLFGPPGAGGFDLAALNIQRGRDHGLPSYTEVLKDVLGYDISGWDDLTFQPDVKELLMSVYDDVNDIDLWIGGLSELHVNGGLMGELFSAILIDQFERLRAGDLFWYQKDGMFEDIWLDMIEGSTMSQVVMRNTTISTMQLNAFYMGIPEPGTLAAFLIGLAGLYRVRRRTSGT